MFELAVDKMWHLKLTKQYGAVLVDLSLMNTIFNYSMFSGNSGEHVKKAVEIIENIITQYGFEPAMTLQCLTSRQIDIFTSITFNRDYPLEEKRAKLCP